MKKILTLALVVVLAFAMMAISVSAAEVDNLDDTTNSTTRDVTVEVELPVGAQIQTVYMVDVSWESLNFTYTFGEAPEWDAENHEYTGGTESGWTGGGVSTITVTNHSNADVTVSASFGGESSVTTSGVTATLDKESVDLDNAEGTTVAEAPSDTFTCSVSGIPTSSTGFAVGTITVSFEAK